MEYQALYRKWRPKVFADVIGQPHITETLRRQVAEGRTSHAYLFTGTRGTGKTTCAKILAKAVNCEQPVNGDPCGKCPSCLGIENGGFLDVLELDAASNSGVDQVRALRSEAIYSPANVKKRVYIIDEVHMLSDAAFNALLKIMEEPPEHLMFILATTEVHKILPTILSRCQRFSFRRIPPQLVAERLNFVAEQEGIDLKPDGAELLSRLADGALRDGLSLLDQCAAPGGAIDAEAVLDVLGLAGNLQTARMMEAILDRDAQDALKLLDELYNNGKDMGAVLSELSALTRDLLLRKTAPEGGAELLSGGYDTALLDRLGRGVSGTRFLYFASTLQKASAELYFSGNRRLDTELCLLRLCDESLSGDLTALATRVRRLEDAFAGVAASVQGQPKTPSRAVPERKPEPIAERRPEPIPEHKSEAKPEPITERRPEPIQERKSETKPEPIAECGPEPIPERKSEAKPEPITKRGLEPERKPESIPDRKSGPAVEQKPAPRSEREPEPKPASSLDAEREAADLPPLELLEPPPEAMGGMDELPWDLLETAEKVSEEPHSETLERRPAEEAPAMEPPSEPQKPAAPLQTPREASPAAAAIPTAAAESSGPVVEVGNWWPTAVEKSKGRLSPMYRAFLNYCTGVLEGSVVAVYAPDEITVGRLDNERVRTALMEESQAAIGTAPVTQLVFKVGNPPVGSPEENLSNLLKTFGGQYDNVQIT